ncbi:N-acetyltransferase [Pectobacterium odoriferum]|uniref:N-acetyltransferase n=1 Tax=Pectobacterium odoriferum TaxID=78398 RepID=UPI000CD1280A|nr:N-acetyltransferase [Pectobacterium odoriferum]POD97066.1 hypothetical protein BVY06_07070 [Pectobacterium odoriferum]
MDSDGITQLIKLRMATEPPEIEISNGNIFNQQSNLSDNYRITFGWDVFTAYSCDVDWNAFRLNISSCLDDLTDSDRQLEEAKIASEDKHWRWFNKSICLKSNEYKWFFFRVNNEVQAACLIYHPKTSVLENKQLFYIEFIAVAPWNRYNPINVNKYKGVGSIFLKGIMSYCVDTLKYQPGMCLHSLPQAQTFYEKKLKMVHCEQADKDGLWYYEMHEDNFIDFVRA